MQATPQPAPRPTTKTSWRTFSPVHDNLCVNDVRIGGVSLRLVDHKDSVLTECVRAKLEQDDYALERIPFSSGDWVVDIGANVGMVCIYLAKRFPETRIVAIEPIAENFSNLVQRPFLLRYT